MPLFVNGVYFMAKFLSCDNLEMRKIANISLLSPRLIVCGRIASAGRHVWRSSPS